MEKNLAQLQQPGTLPPHAAPQPNPGTEVNPSAKLGGADRRLSQIRPVAEPASMRPRHWGLILSFLVVVLLPVVVTVFYLFVIAEDQYSSTVGFTVRREEGSDVSSSLLGGLAKFAGTSNGSESDILYEFIQSQEIVETIDKRLDLRKLFGVHWPGDPIFALKPDATIEEVLDYWLRMVRISYDQSTGLIEIRVLAFTPEEAQTLAGEVLAESQRKINDLNTQARQDLMRYATDDLEVALTRLKGAREAMTQFRTRTSIVDPESDIQGRMGVISNLQQQLAASLVDYDLLRLQTDNSDDPRITQAKRRIDVIRERIAAERQTFSNASGEVGEINEDYPELIAEYESLLVDREYAEETYRLALASVDLSRAEASRQNLYLAPFVRPTLPQTAEYPQRFVLTSLVALFLVLAWTIAVLIYYSVRDRR